MAYAGIMLAKFQSRNRESSNFNALFGAVLGFVMLFQSRNRESSNFNTKQQHL